MKVTGSSIEQLEKDKTRKRCRKWRLWLSTDQGRKSRRLDGSYSDAQDALKAFRAEVDGKVASESTFGDCALSWSSWRAQTGDYAPNTIANDKRATNALARTYIWDMPISEITPKDCRDAIAKMRDEPVNVDRLSGTSLNKLYRAMWQVFSQAKSDGLLTSNPLEGVKAPKVDTREKQAMSRQEVDAVLDKLGGMEMDGHVMAVYLMLLLGLRRGEALALGVADVEDGICRVDKSVKERDGSIDRPKSDAGVRSLPVPPPLQDAIDRWVEARAERGLSDAPTLCCNVYGGVMRPQNMYKWWESHKERLGCHGYSMHQLRHTNLTIMARHMSPFDLQRYAGWSSIAPARIYIHPDLDSVAKAVSEVW